MNEKNLNYNVLQQFALHLRREEKSEATTQKYLRDTAAFLAFAGQAEITKELVIAFKQHLVAAGYAVRSVNSMLASLNSLRKPTACSMDTTWKTAKCLATWICTRIPRSSRNTPRVR